MSVYAPPLEARTAVHGHAHAHVMSDAGPGAESAVQSTPDVRSDAEPDPAARLLAAPPPDPFEPPRDDDDALLELEEEIQALSAHIDAAVYRLLTLVAEFDRRGGWKIGGHRSCAHWLRYRTAVDLGTAREKVRTARALESLPKISEEMASGRLSFSQARALTRVATPESEEELLDVARSVTVADLERFIRAWWVMSRKDEAELEQEQYRSRAFAVYPDEMGMYEVRGKVTAEVGAVLMRAVEAAGEALFTKESANETTAKQRRADAIGLLAERALAAGFGGEDVSYETGEASGDVSAEPSAWSSGSAQRPNPFAARPAERNDAETPPSREGAPVSGSRAERYQVVLHVEPSTLAEDGGVQSEGAGGGEDRREGAGQGLREACSDRSHLEDGTHVSAETCRRLACDSSLVRAERGAKGEVLDVGRRTRTVPPAIRRALEVRDRGCTLRPFGP